MFDYLPPENLNVSVPVVHERMVSLDHSYEMPSLNSIAKAHLKTMTRKELDNDWKLNEFFGSIVVINLPHDTERLSRIIEELHQVGVHDFEIFPAINGRQDVDEAIWRKFKHTDLRKPEDKEALDRLHKGEAGCYLSHYRVIQNIKNSFENALWQLNEAIKSNNQEGIKQATKLAQKYSRVLILEDDNGFGIVDEDKISSSKTGVGYLLRQALLEIPDKWDMLYLMCAPHEKTKSYSPHLYRLKRSVFLNAYVVNYTMYVPIINALKKIDDPKVKKIYPVDKAISIIHEYFRVYAIYPSIAFQYGGVSSIASTTSEKLTQCQPILPK